MNNIIIEIAITCLEYRTEIYMLLFSSALFTSLLLIGGSNE